MFRHLIWRIRKRRFCKANRWFCPDCIYHEHLLDGAVYRGVRCHYPTKGAGMKDLRKVCLNKYGEDFVKLYDMVNSGIPIGTLEETIKFLGMVEAARQEVQE